MLGQALFSNEMVRFTEAEASSREAQQMFQDLFEESFWRVAVAKVVLGEALVYSAKETPMAIML